VIFTANSALLVKILILKHPLVLFIKYRPTLTIKEKGHKVSRVIKIFAAYINIGIWKKFYF